MSKWEPTRWENNKIIIEKRKQRDDGIKFRIGLNDSENICLGKNEKWYYEPMSSQCHDDFFEQCRFDTFEEAVELANRQITITRFEYEIYPREGKSDE